MNKVFSSLLLHPNTSSQLESFAGQPASVLLISGRRGSGKKTLAKHLAAGLLAVEPAELLNQPYFIVLSKPQDKTEISIDSIRQLIGKMNLKVPAGASEKVNRVAVVEDAHYLSTEAQNALLKLLEEPPAGTLLVLTSDSEELHWRHRRWSRALIFLAAIRRPKWKAPGGSARAGPDCLAPCWPMKPTTL
jgi:DNA polymerase III delta prime subunit